MVLVALGCAVTIGFLYPNTGQKEAKFEPGKPQVVHDEPPATPLPKNDVAASEQVLDAFVATAVLRRHLNVAYDLVTAQMRDGMGRAEWRKGDIPVVPFPAKDFGLAKSKLRYSHGNIARYDVAILARPRGRTGSAVFTIELHALKRGGKRRWLVDYWEPLGGGIGTAPVPRANPLGLRQREPSATAQPLGTAWVFVPLAILSVVVLLPLGLAVRGWVRNRRIDRAYAKTLPPLKPPS